MQEEHKIIGDVRGPGLYIGVELIKDKKTKERAVNEANEMSIKLFGKGIIILDNNCRTSGKCDQAQAPAINHR